MVKRGLTFYVLRPPSLVSFIELRFPEPRRVGRVAIYWSLDRGIPRTSAEVQVQIPEGQGWRTVAVAKPREPVPVIRILLEKPVRAKVFRLFQPRGRGPTGRPHLMWVREVELFEEPHTIGKARSSEEPGEGKSGAGVEEKARTGFWREEMKGGTTEMFIEQTELFVSGEEGYHTYRIPAVVVTPQGTVLAFCEGRRNSPSDHGDIDLMLRRSLDGGRTWEGMQRVWADGENTVGNPCPVVDRETGTIWLPFCWNNDRVFVTHSSDEGASWSPPVEITAQVKPPDWTWYATGPGHGIQLRNGRLLIPCDHRVQGQGEVMFSHVFYSDDHGATWQRGGSLPRDTDECVAVQTMDGSVYLNMRSYHGRNRRVYAWSQDGGETWSPIQFDETLIEPVCQASLIRFTDEQHHDRNRILFSNPASTERERMTVRLSYDECRTWSVAKVLHEGPAAYSSLCVLSDGTIGCLYERGAEHRREKITWARFNLEWLTDGEDRL